MEESLEHRTKTEKVSRRNAAVIHRQEMGSSPKLLLGSFNSAVNKRIAVNQFA